MFFEFFLVLGRPQLLVAALHQERHQSPDLQDLVQQMFFSRSVSSHIVRYATTLALRNLAMGEGLSMPRGRHWLFITQRAIGAPGE